MIDLTKLHTRQLLKLLKQSRKYYGGIMKDYNFRCEICSGLCANKDEAEVYKIDESVYTTKEEIKKELEKRPHVPNKQEARRIRQEKAKKSI